MSARKIALAEDAVGSSTPPCSLTDDQLQDYLLQGVSRTFALTIPQLPASLGRVIANAYLLCRIVDTIEDEPTLDAAGKKRLCVRFADVVDGGSTAPAFAAELSPMLSRQTLAAERELVALTPRVIAITRRFDPAQQAAIKRCVRIMATGMAEFQQTRSVAGLATLADMDRYCYVVAGVVGEMLTSLFCHYSPAIARHEDKLMVLAVSFGQGLQMTNILKDIWEDRARGSCWLPRSLFAEHGVDLARLEPGQAGFSRGLDQLVAIAHGHLRNALCYTLLIPRNEKGLRNFCLWAIGMAVLTLRKLEQRRDFDNGRQVKISRRSVKLTILLTRWSRSSDRLLQLLFNTAASALPHPQMPPDNPSG